MSAFENSLTKISSLFINFLLLFICFYSFFWYFFPSSSFQLILFISFLGFSCSLLKKNKLRFNNLGVFFIIFYVLFKAVFIDEASIQNYSILFSSCCLIYIFLGNFYNWNKIFIKLLFYFSSIHVFFTVYAFSFPLNFQEFLLKFFPASFINSIEVLPGIQGITNQTALNAFYITIFISICYTYLDEKHGGWRYLITLFVLLIGVFSLLLTAKRGFLVANLVSAIITYLSIEKLQRNFFLRLSCLIALFSILAGLFYSFFQDAILLFLRLDSGTSGRFDLYKLAVFCIEEKPFWGHGFRYFAKTFGVAVHNTYLQLWCDLGAVGLLLFFFFFLINLFVVCKCIWQRFSWANKDQRPLLWSLYMQVFFLIYGVSGNPIEDIFIFVIYLVAASIPFSFWGWSGQVKMDNFKRPLVLKGTI